MKKHVIFFLAAQFFLLALNEPAGFAQLVSPGQLSKAHQKLDGFNNCTKCHSLGKGIAYSECTACHEKLVQKIKEGKGLHARVRECISCHTEHKGRDAGITQFEKETFDHTITGFEIQGGHKDLPCEKCHKENVYNGLSRSCLSCHADVHAKTVSGDCLQCHGFSNWKTVQFSHAIPVKFNLTGKHIDVKCDACHRRNSVTITVGKTETVYNAPLFVPLRFEKCSDCHGHIHDENLKAAACKSCHTPDNWKETAFSHNNPALSKYQLSGKHEKVSCDLCHPPKTIVFEVNGKTAERSIKQFKPIKHDSCRDCHYDVHEGQFRKQNCDSCHSLDEGWKNPTFRHESKQYTGFKLAGKHKDVACDKCHPRSQINYIEFDKPQKASAGRFKPLKSGGCNDCHKDDHKGSFREIENVKDVTCTDCHSVDREWKDRRYNHKSENYRKYTGYGNVEESKCEQCHICSTDKFCISCCIESMSNFGLPVGR